VHVVAPAPAGGLESVVEALVGGQRRTGHDVRLVATLGEGESRPPLLERLTEWSVPTTELRIPARAYLRERGELGRALDGMRPDVVHTHGYRCDVVAAPVARSRGVPTVSTVHGFTGGGTVNRIYEWMQERALRRHDAVVAVSRPLVARLERHGVPRDRIHLVPNALPEGGVLLPREAARARLGLGAGEFVVGWVGRLSAEKGPDIAAAAWELMREAGVSLSFVGEGPMRQVLRETPSGGGASARLRLHGLVPRASEILRAFDVVLLSSRTEGAPMILLEAMRAGVPVVATAVGGVPDVVGSGEAILVPAENADAIARAVLATRDAPDHAAARVAAARERARTVFGVETWLDRYERIYRSLRRAPTSRRALLSTSHRERSRVS
jgi:glycosyltransferase involved in cell wall biosynthesis